MGIFCINIFEIYSFKTLKNAIAKFQNLLHAHGKVQSEVLWLF